MKRTKRLALIGIYTALLIGAQFALSFVSGLEIVTVLFFSFAFVFGVKMSVLTGIAFSLLRCLVFGFYPSVLIEYLIFYTFFAIAVGGFGHAVKRKLTLKAYIVALIVALSVTFTFTVVDNVVSPLYFGLDRIATTAYHSASVATLISQLICTALTVGVLFPPIFKVMERFRASFI